MDLEFERPHLFAEPKPVAAEEEEEPVVEDAVEDVSPPDDDDDDESWRDEVVADIFDGPRPPRPQVPFKDYGDFIAHWVEQKLTREREERARKRWASGEHVCAETDSGEPTFEHDEASTPEALGGPPGAFR